MHNHPLLHTRALGLFLGAILAGHAQEAPTYTEFAPPENSTEFAFDFGGLPDLTGDGVSEFFVYSNERTYIYDGSSLKLHFTLQSPCRGGVGHVASAGDLTGDGIPELMGNHPCVLGGQVSFFNGVSGQLLFTVPSPNPVFLGLFGATSRVIPDMTGDGKDDWLIHQPELETATGRVYIFDSQTRKVVRTIRNADTGFSFPLRNVEVIPDVDGDGKPDLVIGAQGATVKRDGKSMSNAGRVVVRSLETGKVLYELIDPEPQTDGGFGLVVTSIGDITGDKIGDIAVGTHFKDNETGAVYLFSGADGRWLRTLRSPQNPFPGGRFARGVAPLADLNGDGAAELWVEEDGSKMSYVFDGSTSALLKTIPSPDPLASFYIASVGQTGAPGIRGYLFGWQSAGVYFVPFMPIPRPTRLKPVEARLNVFRLQVTGEPGRKVEVQASGDFTTWEPITSLMLGDQATELEDSGNTGRSRRFYRARQSE